MDVIITYDVDQNAQAEVKRALTDPMIGFKDEVKHDGKLHLLPNTTFISTDKYKNPVEARRAVDDVIAKLNLQRAENNQIKITRFFACTTGLKMAYAEELESSNTKSFFEMSHDEKKDFTLLMLYINTKENKFIGQIVLSDILKQNGWIVDNQDIDRIVNDLKLSNLIAIQTGREKKISFDAFSRGVEFVQNNSYAEPGTSILSLYELS